jgi:hypothetical protein
VKWTQGTALPVATLMVIPILMVVLSLVLPHNVNRWANIIVAVFWFLFNLVGLRNYPGHYGKCLLAVSMVFNVITVWYAWKWVKTRSMSPFRVCQTDIDEIKRAHLS